MDVPAQILIYEKAGKVRCEFGTPDSMNGTDELDYAFSITPEMATELGRRLIGAALRAQDDTVAANLERKKNQS